MKYLFLITVTFCLISCSFYKYCIITRVGVVAYHIQSKEECESIIKQFDIKGICVRE